MRTTLCGIGSTTRPQGTPGPAPAAAPGGDTSQTGTRPRSRRGQEEPLLRGGVDAAGNHLNVLQRPAVACSSAAEHTAAEELRATAPGHGAGARGTKVTKAGCESSVGGHSPGVQEEAKRCAGLEVQALLICGLDASSPTWRDGRGIRRFRAVVFLELDAAAGTGAVRERP